MIKSSLNSMSVKMNFLVHNLAQVQHRGHKEGALLSFVPRTYTRQQDGALAGALVEKCSCQSSSSNLIFRLTVKRQCAGANGHLDRSRSEFLEFHRALREQFPRAPLPSVELLGSSSKQRGAALVARASNLQKYINGLLQLAGEISECDLVYTFFHPLVSTTQEEEELTNSQEISSSSAASVAVQGEIEMSVRYKDGRLTVFLAGARNLGLVVSLLCCSLFVACCLCVTKQHLMLLDYICIQAQLWRK